MDASRNIDMQGLVLIIAGAFGWIAVLSQPRQYFMSINRLALALGGLFAVCSLLSAAVNPHLGYNLLGAPYLRLGALGLLACVGIGLLLAATEIKPLARYLYLLIVTVAVVSVPYSWLKFQSLERLPGLFAQADIMAIFIGCGILLGLYLWQHSPSWRRRLIYSQLLLVVVLLLTETRAVLMLTLGLSLAWLIWQQRPSARTWVAYLTCLVLITLAGFWLAPARFDHSAIRGSTTYRLSLQQAAWHHVGQKPLLGYGPGNLADALNCHGLTAPALQQTCHNGYFFNSSHNIFLDRILALGWPAGFSYLALVVLAIWKALCLPQTRILGFLILLFALYYLTNVTSLSLELLLWILMLRSLNRVSA